MDTLNGRMSNLALNTGPQQPSKADPRREEGAKLLTKVGVSSLPAARRGSFTSTVCVLSIARSE